MPIHHIATHTDAYGDRLQIKAAQGELGGQQHLTIETGSGDILVFAPGQARQIAADLVKAADDTEAAAKEPAPSNDVPRDDPWQSTTATPRPASVPAEDDRARRAATASALGHAPASTTAAYSTDQP